MAQQPVPNIEQYVDVDDALKRVCGNIKIYKKLLGSFKNSLQMDQLEQEVAAGNYDVGAQIAHTIKGVTANLSLKAAYEKTVAVEAALKQGAIQDEDIKELRRILDTTLLCTEYIVETM